MSLTDHFFKKALTAIEKADFETIESLRDQIRPEHIAPLVKSWHFALPWTIKDGYVALLMDQINEQVRPIMEDALNSPTPETKAYALCILKGDFDFFTYLLTPSGWIDPQKVEQAIIEYRWQTF